MAEPAPTAKPEEWWFEKRGKLLSKKKNILGWKERFLEINKADQSICLYRNPGERLPVCFIPFSEILCVILQTSERCRFDIVQYGRVHEMKTLTTKDSVEWVAAIEMVQSYFLKTVKQSPGNSSAPTETKEEQNRIELDFLSSKRKIADLAKEPSSLFRKSFLELHYTVSLLEKNSFDELLVKYSTDKSVLEVCLQAILSRDDSLNLLATQKEDSSLVSSLEFNCPKSPRTTLANGTQSLRNGANNALRQNSTQPSVNDVRLEHVCKYETVASDDTCFIVFRGFYLIIQKVLEPMCIETFSSTPVASLKIIGKVKTPSTFSSPSSECPSPSSFVKTASVSPERRYHNRSLSALRSPELIPSSPGLSPATPSTPSGVGSGRMSQSFSRLDKYVLYQDIAHKPDIGQSKLNPQQKIRAWLHSRDFMEKIDAKLSLEPLVLPLVWVVMQSKSHPAVIRLAADRGQHTPQNTPHRRQRSNSNDATKGKHTSYRSAAFDANELQAQMKIVNDGAQEPDLKESAVQSLDVRLWESLQRYYYLQNQLMALRSKDPENNASRKALEAEKAATLTAFFRIHERFICQSVKEYEHWELSTPRAMSANSRLISRDQEHWKSTFLVSCEHCRATRDAFAIWCAKIFTRDRSISLLTSNVLMAMLVTSVLDFSTICTKLVGVKKYDIFSKQIMNIGILPALFTCLSVADDFVKNYALYRIVGLLVISDRNKQAVCHVSGWQRLLFSLIPGCKAGSPTGLESAQKSVSSKVEQYLYTINSFLQLYTLLHLPLCLPFSFLNAIDESLRASTNFHVYTTPDLFTKKADAPQRSEKFPSSKSNDFFLSEVSPRKTEVGWLESIFSSKTVGHNPIRVERSVSLSNEDTDLVAESPWEENVSAESMMPRSFSDLSGLRSADICRKNFDGHLKKNDPVIGEQLSEYSHATCSMKSLSMLHLALKNEKHGPINQEPKICPSAVHISGTGLWQCTSFRLPRDVIRHFFDSVVKGMKTHLQGSWFLLWFVVQSGLTLVSSEPFPEQPPTEIPTIKSVQSQHALANKESLNSQFALCTRQPIQFQRKSISSQPFCSGRSQLSSYLKLERRTSVCTVKTWTLDVKQVTGSRTFVSTFEKSPTKSGIALRAAPLAEISRESLIRDRVGRSLRLESSPRPNSPIPNPKTDLYASEKSASEKCNAFIGADQLGIIHPGSKLVQMINSQKWVGTAGPGIGLDLPNVPVRLQTALHKLPQDLTADQQFLRNFLRGLLTLQIYAEVDAQSLTAKEKDSLRTLAMSGHAEPHSAPGSELWQQELSPLDLAAVRALRGLVTDIKAKSTFLALVSTRLDCLPAETASFIHDSLVPKSISSRAQIFKSLQSRQHKTPTFIRDHFS